jgi:hypothetical protein
MRLWSMCHCCPAIFQREFRLQREKYSGLGHAVDRSIHGMEKRFSCYLLLHHDYRHVFEFRSHGMERSIKKEYGSKL